MWHTRLGLTILITLLSTYHAHADQAGLLESMVMPGPVIEGHAEYESSCGKCHSLFDKDRQTTLCRDCHKDINRDLVRKVRFHGQSDAVSTTECRSCHTDHIGRSVDITGLNRTTFDHELTQFSLAGQHQTVSCDSCHDNDKAFRDTTHECIDCHADDDVHQDALGDSCGDCHNAKQWKDSEFIHDETEFPLEGAHGDASCDSCHPDNRYIDTPLECNDCHRIDDVHGGQQGSECSTCHEPRKWSEVTFDHGGETDFSLHGEHKSIACESCHNDTLDIDNQDLDCHTCHAKNDIHRERFGTGCDQCHTESEWDDPTFVHDNDTDYHLTGSHKNVSCESCHQSAVVADAPVRDCIDCHQSDDVHKGDQGNNCARCHNDDRWPEKIRFDHDLTNFPLIGLHAALPCEACHLSGEFQQANTECHGCHASDDTHEGRLGNSCASCHTPNDWQLWQFAHDTQTDFALNGKHQSLDCLACHLAPTKDEISLSSECADCHQEDDVHEGNFGSECDRCHNADSFLDPEIYF